LLQIVSGLTFARDYRFRNRRLSLR
jgi:hypothetical protein